VTRRGKKKEAKGDVPGGRQRGKRKGPIIPGLLLGRRKEGRRSVVIVQNSRRERGKGKGGESLISASCSRQKKEETGGSTYTITLGALKQRQEEKGTRKKGQGTDKDFYLSGLKEEGEKEARKVANKSPTLCFLREKKKKWKRFQQPWSGQFGKGKKKKKRDQALKASHRRRKGETNKVPTLHSNEGKGERKKILFFMTIWGEGKSPGTS